MADIVITIVLGVLGIVAFSIAMIRGKAQHAELRNSDTSPTRL